MLIMGRIAIRLRIRHSWNWWVIRGIALRRRGSPFRQGSGSLNRYSLCHFDRCSVIRIFECVLPDEVQLAKSLFAFKCISRSRVTQLKDSLESGL
jgi:hypothetical protein